MLRRAVLGGLASGLVGSGSGCLDLLADQADQEPDHDGWPMAGYDAGNTGHHREATVPASAPQQLWSQGFGELELQTGPVVHDGLVLVGTRGDPNHQGPFRLHAFDEATGEQRWTQDIAMGLFSPAAPAVVDGTVYVRIPRTMGIWVEALDASDGSRRWRREVDARIVGSFVVADGRLFVTMDEALLALDPENGEQLWRTAVEPVANQPAVGNGAVHVGCEDGRVRAFDVANGDQRWEYDLGGEIRTAPAIRDGVVYAGTGERLIALRGGDVDWEFEPERVLTSPVPAVDGERVYVGGRNLYGIDASTGDARWKGHFERDTYLNSPPSVADGTVIVTQVGRVFGFDAATGTRRWRVEGPWFATGRPAIADGTVYVSEQSGTLYAFGEGSE